MYAYTCICYCMRICMWIRIRRYNIYIYIYIYVHTQPFRVWFRRGQACVLRACQHTWVPRSGRRRQPFRHRHQYHPHHRH
jgi:hypothetical protein